MVHVVFDSTNGYKFDDNSSPDSVSSEVYITMSPYADEKGEINHYYISKVNLIISNLVDATLE